MTSRALAVSLVAFDGHPLAAALEAVAAAGASHAEPAFIDGTMEFSEDDLTEAAGAALGRRIAEAGLGCRAVSAHMDCGADGAAPRLLRRLRFAAALGAEFVITNSSRTDRRAALRRTLEAAQPEAAACGVRIALENPGHGPADLLARGAAAPALLEVLTSPWVTFNYDPGNVLTNSEGTLRPEAEFAAVLPLASHLHLKDMVQAGDRWAYVAVGEGMLDWAAMLACVPETLPLCVELPLRQFRPPGQPPRRGEVPELPDIIAAVTRSVGFVQGGYVTRLR